MLSWNVGSPAEQAPLATSSQPSEEVKIALRKNFEFKLPLAWLLANPVAGEVNTGGPSTIPPTSLLRLRFSLWQDRLPVDALPLEGWIELKLLSEQDLVALTS